ncbi:hypothetical protein Cgig2_005284 [Carnegiea gigantea]|uniref:Uncharacterized protein n=1 Tax=Carnegiea gigantea TaxID=171969 RepID=A0A9Q1GYK4_9CARY|nr:hypothetical protein Cgig2_005284 [Carnegiea gigantea]
MDDAACKDAPVGGPDDVTLEINYGGVFEKGENGLVEDVGFTNIEEIYYVIPWLSMEDGIRPLKTDYDSLDMLQPKIQQMPIPSQAQRGRGKPTSRRRGRGLGRGRGRATERGREGERIRTNISADNASISGATSTVDVEVGHFLSQASVGSSCLPHHEGIKIQFL